MTPDWWVELAWGVPTALAIAAISAVALRVGVTVVARLSVGYGKTFAIALAGVAVFASAFMVAERLSAHPWSVALVATFASQVVALTTARPDSSGVPLGVGRALLTCLVAFPVALLAIAGAAFVFFKHILCGLFGQCI